MAGSGAAPGSASGRCAPRPTRLASSPDHGEAPTPAPHIQPHTAKTQLRCADREAPTLAVQPQPRAAKTQLRCADREAPTLAPHAQPSTAMHQPWCAIREAPTLAPRPSARTAKFQLLSAVAAPAADSLRRTTQLTCPAAQPTRSRDAQSAVRNRSHGRVRCSAWFGLWALRPATDPPRFFAGPRRSTNSGSAHPTTHREDATPVRRPRSPNSCRPTPTTRREDATPVR